MRLSFLKELNGETTHFAEKILRSDKFDCKAKVYANVEYFGQLEPKQIASAKPKIHTIRESGQLAKRIEHGKKDVEAFHWSDKPYRSPQIVFASIHLTGFQTIQIFNGCVTIGKRMLKQHEIDELIVNDGLTNEQFQFHFKGTWMYGFSGFIYHWTSKRY